MAAYVQQIIPEKNNIYTIPIFKHFNERAAILALNIKPSDGVLGISIAPSTLRGQNTGKQSVVEKGTKVYDYSREIYTNLTYIECLKIRNYMKPRVEKDNAAILQGVSATLQAVNSLLIQMKGQSEFETYSNYIAGIANQFAISQEDKGLPIFRNNDREKKMWAFNYNTAQDGKNLLYVSATKNGDKSTRVYITLGEDAAAPFYYALNSYIENHAIISMLAGIYTYLDGEIQIIKVAEYKKLLESVYGINMELATDGKDTLEKINQGIIGAMIQNIFQSKNLRSFTGATTYQDKSDDGGNANFYNINSEQIPY